jgi:putative transposase
MTKGIFNQYTGYHNRRSIRLRGYDYSRPGYYFITICIHDRKKRLLGNIINNKFIENDFSGIVRACWNDLPNHYRYIRLDEFIIMPNHIHGIINICDAADVRAGLKPALTGTTHDCHGAGLKPAPTKRHGLPEIIRALKTFSSRQINNTGQFFKWQRNYYDHIIRDDNSLYFIRKYIRENPLNWSDDQENHINREITEFQIDE